jgi:nucleotide-binding universal stress UspA family protein
MKRILLPTDFSDSAWNALFTAVKLYAEVPCHFYLLNAYKPDVRNLLGNQGKIRLGMIYDSLAKQSKGGLQETLDYLAKNHKNDKHNFEKISRSDHLESAVKEIVREKDIDTVIMGTKGATGAKEIFLGSNTVKVIKAIRNRPIIAVPEEHNLQKMEKVAFPTDFTRPFETFELRALVELASLWKSEVMIVQVGQEFSMTDSQNSNKKILQRRLEDIRYSFHRTEFKTKVANAIEDFAKKKEADMISLIHYRHTFMEKLTREPVIKKIAFHADVPLLVLPE